MPSKTPKQARFMAAIAHSRKFAKKAGVPQSVGKEFNDADQKKKVAQDAKKPFDRPKDSVAMHRHMAVMKRGQSEHRDTYSEAHMTKDYTPERHKSLAEAYTRMAKERPEHAEHANHMAATHLNLAERKSGNKPTVKVRRKIAQDAPRKPFGTFEDHMVLGSNTLAMKKSGGKSVAHRTMGYDPKDHHDAIRYHSFHAEHLADRADRTKSPKLKEKYGKLSDAHADLAQVHLDLARRKQGIIPTVKAKGNIPSAKPKG